MQNIKFWLKVTNKSERKYINIIHVYQIMLKDIENKPYITNWAYNVKDTLNELVFSEALYSQGVCNAKLFLLLLKQIS